MIICHIVHQKYQAFFLYKTLKKHHAKLFKNLVEVDFRGYTPDFLLKVN